jgi:hypothetical protein
MNEKRFMLVTRWEIPVVVRDHGLRFSIGYAEEAITEAPERLMLIRLKLSTRPMVRVWPASRGDDSQGRKTWQLTEKNGSRNGRTSYGRKLVGRTVITKSIGFGLPRNGKPEKPERASPHCPGTTRDTEDRNFIERDLEQKKRKTKSSAVGSP